jgi:hypothetical protein
VVDLLQDAHVLTPQQESRHPVEDHHDSAIFFGEFIMVGGLGGAVFGCVL